MMMDLAIEIAQNQPFIFPLPLWAADTLVAATGLVNRDVHDVALFATTLSRIDVVSPEYGTHRLRDFFMQCKAAL